MEKIVSIEKATLETDHHWSCLEGFKVITDEQEIFLGIDTRQDCCESFGYFMSEDNLQEFVGSNLLRFYVTDTELRTYENEEIYSRDEGGIMFVTFETSNGSFQFVAYNCHNGYYGHEAIVKSDFLNHSVHL